MFTLGEARSCASSLLNQARVSRICCQLFHAFSKELLERANLTLLSHCPDKLDSRL